MLHLPCKITFGTYDRFTAQEYTSPLVNRPMIFVNDNHVLDETNLPTVIFQEWADQIGDVAELLQHIEAMYPSNFMVTQMSIAYEMKREGMKYHSF